MPASIVGKGPNVRPVFGVEVFERTALRPMMINGKAVVINGKIATISIPKNECENVLGARSDSFGTELEGLSAK